MRSILRLGGLALIAAFIAISALAFYIPSEETFAESSRPAPSQAIAFAPLPAVNAQADRSILDRSPFVQDHAAFDRDAAAAPPPPPVDVRLTGILKLGTELRASLMIDGRSLIVRKGDETPIGKVTSIENSAIVVEGSTRQRFEMFRP